MGWVNLDETQKKKVTDWISQGLKLSEIQNRMASELGLKLTYMDVRLLVDDLKLTPRDVEPVKSATLGTGGPAPAPSAARTSQAAQTPTETAQPAGKVSVSVDQIARPGAVASGKVTFSDGNSAEWYFDQMGRLGLLPKQQGYRPPQEDLQQFQMALDAQLNRMGF
jgi:hypothetical protein